MAIDDKYMNVLTMLLDRLSLQELYMCVAEIPGPLLEMRSGTLPLRVSRRELVSAIVKHYNLDKNILRNCRRSIANRYRLNEIVRNYRKLAATSDSRKKLTRSYLRGVMHKLSGRSVYYNRANKLNEVDLSLDGHRFRLIYPDELVSIGLISEIFIDKTYQFDMNVDYIYDLGANIGLSAVYFNVKNPGTKVVCVEPMQENFDILTQNINANGFDVITVNGAVGRERGQTTIYYGDQSHALPSLYTKQVNSRRIELYSLSDIVSNEGTYGLKIDIEGGEEAFGSFGDIIANAEFIVGELHYSKDAAKNARVDAFYDIVKKNFEIEEGHPTLYFIGDDIELCYCYTAQKRQ